MKKILRLVVITIGLLVLLLALAGEGVLAGGPGGKWSVTGSMTFARDAHTATPLATGEVLVAGGSNNCATGCIGLSSAELYHPATGIWRSTGSMHKDREGHSATLLGNGEVLGAGGISVAGQGSLTSAELFVPST